MIFAPILRAISLAWFVIYRAMRTSFSGKSNVIRRSGSPHVGNNRPAVLERRAVEQARARIEANYGVSVEQNLTNS
jgi:hypothetical protein